MSAEELARRVEACLRDAEPHLANMWRECVGMYEADSPAALGCLLALVHEAWGRRVVITEVIGPRASWLRITADGPGDRLLFQADPAHSLAERRACALEAAPSAT